MTNDEIFTKLKEILQTEMSVTVPITEKTALLGEKILDSMDFINYITYIEERFGVKVSDDDIASQKLGILENMVKYLAGKTVG